MKIFKSFHELDSEKYFFVTYFLESVTSLRDAAWNLAIGQSVSNPNVRLECETEELFDNHSCIIIGAEDELIKHKSGIIKIAFPVINIDFKTDGISHLMVNIMGGQLDIDNIIKCQVLDIDFPKAVHNCFLGPKYGISGIRKFTEVYNKPLLGAIIKPKTGMSVDTLLDMVKKVVDGGVNFIKEDEILSNPSFCPIEKRIPIVLMENDE